MLPGRSDHIRAAPSAPFSSDRVWLHLQQFLLGSHTTELRSPRGHGRFAGDRAHHRTLLPNK
jgi:hypothetical protein